MLLEGGANVEPLDSLTFPPQIVAVRFPPLHSSMSFSSDSGLRSNSEKLWTL